MHDGLATIHHLRRCGWAEADELLARYHDEEWGRPPESDDGLFEALSLEIFQAGLSWRTVLRKRDSFRSAFAGFQIDAVARFDERDVARLLADAAIIRHRQKIMATLNNARAVRAIQRESGIPTFGEWLGRLPRDVDAIHRELRPHLAFFGRTTCESFLHAVGTLPPPHEPGCWRWHADDS